jgi:glycosyltransferase involved in cell wall biosynthesis
VLNDGEFGAIVADAELGTALIRLLTDDEERDRRVALGRVRARAFDWAQVARQYEDVYDDVIERRRA